VKSFHRAQRIGLGLLLLVGLVAVACPFRQGEQAKSNATAVPSVTQSADDRARQSFDSFRDQDFASIGAAEQVAGFRIPRPSPSYPMSFDQTTLRWFRGDVRPVSITEYTYVPMAPTSIDLTIGPEHNWDQNDGKSGEQILSYGTPTAILGRDGWLVQQNGGLFFSFHCGEVDGAPVWCNVTAASKIGRAAFDDFVSSIQ
jgi:hypothetical protein